MKKLMALLMVACMVFSILPITASAAGVVASGTCGDNLTWVLTDDGKLTISGEGDMHDFDFVGSPWYTYSEQITVAVIEDGVTTIGENAFCGLHYVTDVELPASIREIGVQAFCCCYALQEIKIAAGVATIDSKAFVNCDSLTFVNIPASVTSIGADAFSGCSALAAIPVDTKNEYYSNDAQGALFDREKQQLIKVPVGIEGHYVIPDSVDEICAGAFAGCAELTEITLGSGVLNLQQGEFYGCSSLTAFHVDEDNSMYSTDDRGVLYSWDKQELIRVPQILSGHYEISKQVLEIGESAFQGCQNLTGVTIPAGTASVGWSAFSDCSSLSEIRFRGNAPEMNYEWIFNGLNATVYYPAGNATWTKNVMQDYDGCITWKPYAVTYQALDQGACGKNLIWKVMEYRTLVISGTGSMYDFAFAYNPWNEYADWFSKVEIGDRVTSLGEYAFNDCSRIESVTIPAGVTAIGNHAFDACDSLSAIYVVEDNPVFSSDDRGVLYDKNKHTLIRAPQCLDGHYILPDSVTALGYGAFEGCIVQTVTISETIDTISERAFSGCSFLTEIHIKDSIQSIGRAAFMSCINLTTVTIPDSVVSVGAEAFWGCSAPYSINIEVGDSVVIGPGDENMGDMEKPDGDEGLKEVWIGKNVTDIGVEAFANCQQLTAIHVDPENAAYCSDDQGVLFDKQKTTLIQAPGAISGSYTIPGSVTTIGDWALSICPNLTSVMIPAGVTQIGDYAFSAHATLCFGYETNLEEIVFCGNAPQMGSMMFWDQNVTVYYPAGNSTWNDDVMQDYGGDITWVPYGEVAKDYSINWVEAYSSLGGNIAVVFKAELSEDLAKAPNAFMRFTYAGKTVDIPVSEATKSGKYHNFYCRIASINMTDDITAQMMVGEQPIGRSATTSLEKYCQYIINTSKDAKTLNLMKAMLNYGAAAQKMMNYKLDNLANKSLSEADKKLTKVDASAYKHNLSGSEAGIKASEALLVLGSETTIRIGFTLTGNKTIDKYTFAVDGVKAEPVYKGGMYRLEVPNIAAHKLDEYHTFTCGDITITYCGLSYVNQIMKSYTEGTTFDMAVALYNYSQATEAFIS